jgi:hypothetical protein
MFNNKPFPNQKPPTSQELQERLKEAERVAMSASVALGEALVLQLADGRDVSPEQAAVQEAGQIVDRLRLILPRIEAAEAEALERTRALLAQEQSRAVAKELPQLVKHALAFSTAYQNAASAFKRMTKSGETIAARLPNARSTGTTQDRLALQLSPGALRKMCDDEINRLGLNPDGSKAVSSPGTNLAAVGMGASSSPATRLPRLEDQIRALAAALLASLAAPEGENGSGGAPPVAPTPPRAPASAAAVPAGVAAGDPARGSVPSLEEHA